jgi:hypothetical protein
MAGVGDIFGKIGGALGIKPKAKPAAGPPSARAGIKPAAGRAAPAARAPVPGAKKPFDIKLYMKAVNLFFKDFFGKKVPYFFKNMGPVFKAAPAWWKRLPQDEQISYGVLILGFVMIITGIVLWIVL